MEEKNAKNGKHTKTPALVPCDETSCAAFQEAQRLLEEDRSSSTEALNSREKESQQAEYERWERKLNKSRGPAIGSRRKHERPDESEPDGSDNQRIMRFKEAAAQGLTFLNQPKVLLGVVVVLFGWYLSIDEEEEKDF